MPLESFHDALEPESLQDNEELYAYLGGKMTLLRDAKINIMTHAFLYGTALFESARGYFNQDLDQLYIFRLEDHCERMRRNCSLLKIMPPSSAEMTRIVIDVVRTCGFKDDCYIRFVFYKSALQIGLGLASPQDFAVFALPQGRFNASSEPFSVCVSSWRRVEDNAIPGRNKLNGAYINSALAKTEAVDNGFDDAVFLNENGRVSEGTGMNLFLVRGNYLITPPTSDNIVEGITRDAVLDIARERLQLQIDVRHVGRSELYTSDEVFFCGTALEVTSIGSVDHRAIGDGVNYPITKKLKESYFEIVRGQKEDRRQWLTPVY